MEDPEFLLRLRYLALEISFICGRMKQETDKCLKGFDRTQDALVFCTKLSEVLAMVAEYNTQNARDLLGHIHDAGKQQDYQDPLEILHKLIGGDLNGNNASKVDVEQPQVLSQNASMHIDLKTENVTQANTTSDVSTENGSPNQLLKTSQASLADDLFDAATIANSSPRILSETDLPPTDTEELPQKDAEEEPLASSDATEDNLIATTPITNAAVSSDNSNEQTDVSQVFSPDAACKVEETEVPTDVVDEVKLQFFKSLEVMPRGAAVKNGSEEVTKLRRSRRLNKPAQDTGNQSESDSSSTRENQSFKVLKDDHKRKTLLLNLIANYFEKRRQKAKEPSEDNGEIKGKPSSESGIEELSSSKSSDCGHISEFDSDSTTKSSSNKEDAAATQQSVVSPFKRKTVLPLQSDSEITLSDPSEWGDVVANKRKVLPLQSDSEITLSDPSEWGDVDTNKRKPVQPLKESDTELTQSDLSGVSTIVEPFKKKVVQPLSETDSEAVREQQNKGEEKCDSEPEISRAQPSQFRLDDDGRDELAGMLDEHHKENNTALCDGDRDNLLNMLTDKELDEQQAPETEGFLLGSSDRDDFLDLLNEEVVYVKTTNTQSDDKCKLSDRERDELLNLLCESVQNSRSAEDCGSEAKPVVGRAELMELVEEYEQTCAKKATVKLEESDGAVIVCAATKGCWANDGDGSPLRDSSGEDSENSVILDVLREESVQSDEPASKVKKRGRPKDQSAEAWSAYQSLLQNDDGDISDSSTSVSDIDIDELTVDHSDQERKRAADEKLHAESKKKFGIDKELIVNVTRTDLSAFDIDRFKVKSTGCDRIDRLCDLSNILQKRKRTRAYGPKSKRVHLNLSSASVSSRSSSVATSSDSDVDSVLTNRDSSSEGRSAFVVSDDEERERFANTLWDDIRNSSDDRSSSSEDGATSEEEEKSKKKKKRRKSDVTSPTSDHKKNGSDTDDSDPGSSGDSAAGSGSEGSKGRKEGDAKDPDLDSSDEEDFVGVRKGRGSWRCDPLLNCSLTSSSSSSGDSDTEHSIKSDTSRKKPRKRKEMKRPKTPDPDKTDSDLEEIKPPKKKSFLFIDDSDDSDFQIIEKQDTPEKAILITDDEESPSKKAKGRRNIRALMDHDDLEEATQVAHNEERERIKRLEERDRAKEIYSQSSSQLTEDDREPLILDVYKDIQLKVHPRIVQKLKPHQRDGIQFMWDNCYESIKQLKENYKGSGCVLAHCMGLGKTLQALALIHTVFGHSITKTKHVLVVCPLSTVSNWKNEFNLAYKGIKNHNIKLYTIEDKKDLSRRCAIIKNWHNSGGVLVVGYDCFWMMIDERKWQKWDDKLGAQKATILEALINPGPDLVICDEGHLLRNKHSRRTQALNRVHTRRRIILTGTPLQNNLLEYYTMVQFVKPNLLGTEKEFNTNFVNPISNGQFGDSTADDIMMMKKRTHVLHKILVKTVQRVEDTELKRYLPKLIDQAVFVQLSDLQIDLYNAFLDNVESRPVVYTKQGNINRTNFLGDIQILRYICIHPNVVTIAERNSKSKIKEQDVIDDMDVDEFAEKALSKRGWYKDLLQADGTKQLDVGHKIRVAIGIVEEAAAHGDKVLIFCLSYAEMDSLEQFLAQHLNYLKNKDYFRMDGTIGAELRTHMCNKFNDNKNIKVFLISVKVGGLGLNLTAANRVIIMNVNWNPSYDTQSVFRAFRFGQSKAVYIYRLVTLDTMEEKMYQRVVTKLAIAHRVVDKHQITRHYSAADIQEFYSMRPSKEKRRLVPNVPEDPILAKLVQKYQFLHRWHEHQALLANRPEEDLDEQQKNAAWEAWEYSQKKPEAFPMNFNGQPPFNPTVNPQPGPSGLQKRTPPTFVQQPGQSKWSRRLKRISPEMPNGLAAPPRLKLNPLWQGVVMRQTVNGPVVVVHTADEVPPEQNPFSTANATVISAAHQQENTIRDINSLIHNHTSVTESLASLDAGSAYQRPITTQAPPTNGVDELNSLITERLNDFDQFSSQDWANDGMNATLASISLSQKSTSEE